MRRREPGADTWPPAKKGTWRSADGRVTNIVEMEDTHLENAIKVLEGKGVSSAARKAATQLGMKEEELNKTQLETDEDMIAMMEAKLAGVPRGIVDKYNELVAERERRQEAGTWKPYIKKVGPNYPRPRRR
jgi:hypothetical protein